jgi:hypothetical protein
LVCVVPNLFSWSWVFNFSSLFLMELFLSIVYEPPLMQGLRFLLSIASGKWKSERMVLVSCFHLVICFLNYYKFVRSLFYDLSLSGSMPPSACLRVWLIQIVHLLLSWFPLGSGKLMLIVCHLYQDAVYSAMFSFPVIH